MGMPAQPKRRKAVPALGPVYGIEPGKRSNQFVIDRFLCEKEAFMFVFGTADDVFAMAVRIEENGSAFYKGAAKVADEPSVKSLFEELAAMEEGHIVAFKTLRSELPGAFPADAVWDPEGLAESYLQITADTHIFTVEAANERLKRVKNAIEALDMALQFEKDSVNFFVGMKEILPDPSGKNQIDKLIYQEMDHIRMLSRVKNQVLAGKAPSLS
jgi:rubrerythrin